MNMQFHIRLKEETKPFHDLLESQTLPKKLYTLTITKEEYIRYLEIFLMIHTSIEDELMKYNQWESFGIDVKRYLRRELLIQDLSLLGVDDLLTTTQTLKINDFETALGYLYVLTGSTMGGMILSKKVSEVFANTSYENANSYFSAFGADTQRMFMEFMKLLEIYVASLSEDKKTSIINGAKECYIFVKEGLENG
ncbi:MAG: biliverdin-producing heme oxygenase [Campylobacterota bacterium]